MGVRGLTTYMYKYCKGAAEPVHIPEIARKYKEETGLDPVIALDISSCVIEIFVMNNIEWLDADRFKIFEIAVNKFLESFTSLGIKFFVVFDGVIPDSKLPVSIKRNKDQVNSCIEFFKNLKDETSNDDDEPYYMQRTGAYTVIESIFESNENCICKYSVVEADEELANYAMNNNCFAYLTADSDFVIYGGAKYCLSIRDLDLEKMTTINFNRAALARGVNIGLKQLPIFAMLCGNDFIPYDVVKYFHHELCPNYQVGKIDYRVQFKAIADFVRKLPHGQRILEKLPEISKRVFKTEEYADRLEAGLKNYFGDLSFPEIPKIGHEIWDKIFEKCYKNHVAFSFDEVVYNVLSGHSIKLGPFLENMEDDNENLPPSVVTTFPLRQKLYGILLYEKPNLEEISIQEWLAFSPNSLDEPFNVKPQFIKHPGLLTLWNESDQTQETVESRWRTFCFAISPKLKYQEFMSLPKDLILPTLSLFYLRNELKTHRETISQLTNNQHSLQPQDFEIKALLAQAVFVNKSTIDEIDQMIEILENQINFRSLDVRTVHLGTVFRNTCMALYSLSVACGNFISRREASAAKYFDGKLLARMYNCQQEEESDKWKDFCNNGEIIENYEKCLNLIMNMD